MAAMHTHAHHQGARPGPGRKAIKQFNERLRRDLRDLERELRERPGRGAIR
jgi:hypothetical protein